METTFLKSVTPGMWVLFILGILALFAYSWKTSYETKGLKKYLNITPPNVVFHIVASLMVFLTLNETGEVLIRKFLPDFDPSLPYKYTLSGLTGLFGSMLVAGILEIGKTIKQKIAR